MWFGLLGTLQVRDGEREVEVPGVRQRVLLAALILSRGQAVSVDRLSELVWDGRPPSRGAVTLRSYVRRLRQAFGPQESGRIITGSGGYRLDAADGRVDIEQFDDQVRTGVAAARSGDWQRAAGLLEQAQALWRGSPLADIPCRALQLTEVPRLEEQRLQAIQWQMEASLQLGRHDQVTPRLTSLTAEHPLREPFHGQLMTALYRSGRQADALSAYRRARDILVGELGLEPGPELRALHQRILANDGELPAGAHPIRAPVEGRAPGQAQAPRATAAAAVPRQLPAASRSFVGRRAEIGTLSSLAEQAGAGPGAPGTVVISAIDGMAGIGKTALAVHAAHLLAPSFPDGQLFVDLHGHTQGLAARDPADALAVVLAACGVEPGQIPEDPEARAALYRARLAGTRTLVVLDNAADERQVRPLLPGDGGCLVLVTSRRRLKALDDARSLALDVLRPADAITLLCDIVGPERACAHDPAAAELAALCGYLPLALRIAAALVRHRPAWTLEHLAALLRHRQHRISTLTDGERDLGAVFDLSYRSLTAEQQRLYRFLALTPGPDIDSYAAATLTATTPAAAGRLLEDLVDHNLLNEPVPDRYRLHDLLRDHARDLVGHDPPNDRDAALARLLDYYQRTALRADAGITRLPRATPEDAPPEHAPALSDPARAEQWLRAERPNLLAALDHVVAHDQPRRIVALTAGLSTLLRTDMPWTQTTTLHTAAAAAARRCDDRHGEAAALAELAAVQAMIGDYAAGARNQGAALELYRELGDGLGEANALAGLGATLGMLGDFNAAADREQTALELYRGLGNRLGQANSLLNLGNIRRSTGETEQALRDLADALELYRGLGNRPGQGNVLNRLAMVRLATGRPAAALRDLEEALELWRGLGIRAGQANTLTRMGDVRRSTDDAEGALRDLTTALELYRELGEQSGQAVALTLLGSVHLAAGEHADAMRHLSEALELHRKIGARGNEAWALNHYAAALAATDAHVRALTHYRDALRLARGTTQPGEEALALEGIGGCLHATGRNELGTAHLEEALGIFEHCGMQSDAARVRAHLESVSKHADP